MSLGDWVFMGGFVSMCTFGCIGGTWRFLRILVKREWKNLNSEQKPVLVAAPVVLIPSWLWLIATIQILGHHTAYNEWYYVLWFVGVLAATVACRLWTVQH